MIIQKPFFMHPDLKIWLKDIELSINEINDFLLPVKNYSNFQKDLKTRKAVERNIEIIGEALNRILKFDPHIEMSDSRKIVDTRNRIIHGSVTADVLWLIVNRYLLIFEAEVERLLQDDE